LDIRPFDFRCVRFGHLLDVADATVEKDSFKYEWLRLSVVDINIHCSNIEKKRGMAGLWRIQSNTESNAHLRLREALENDEPLHVIESIVREDPECVKYIDGDGRLALHDACQLQCSIMIIKILIDSFPFGLIITDHDGNLPLHCALFLGTHRILDCARYLVGIHPEHVVVPNLSGSTPMDLAIQQHKRYRNTLLDLFLHAYPPCASHQFRMYRLLLHLMLDSDSDAMERSILMCVEAYPQGVNTKDILHQLPIHLAVSRRLSKSIIDLLVSFDKSTLMAQDQDGNTPLHIAVTVLPVSNVVQYLVHQCDAACLVQNKEGQVPLHLLCGNIGCQDIDLTKLLVQKSRSATRSLDYNCAYPIHVAACSRKEDVLLYLMNDDPECLLLQDGEGYTPLHWLILLCASPETISYVANACPASVEVKSYNNENALHLALQMRFHLSVIQLFIHLSETILKEKAGEMDHLPLHYAVLNYCEDDVIGFVAQSWPKSLLIGDTDQRTPLHLAVIQGCPLESIQVLIEVEPKALCAADVDGNLPVHLAASCRVPPEIFETLINANKNTLRIRNQEGNLPLHLAFCGFYTSEEAVELLLDGYPDSIEMVDKDGELPLFRTMMSLDLTYLLVKRSIFLFIDH
jgi:ankyrin repeat protein